MSKTMSETMSKTKEFPDIGSLKNVEVIQMGALVGKTGRIKGDPQDNRTFTVVQDFENGLVSVLVFHEESSKINTLQSIPTKMLVFDD